MAANAGLIPIVIGGQAWEAISPEIPAHIVPQFELRSSGRNGQTARAWVKPEDARLIRMAAMRAERSLWQAQPMGDADVRKRRDNAQACQRLVLRIAADLAVEGEWVKI